jgi:hypothetical protein
MSKIKQMVSACQNKILSSSKVETFLTVAFEKEKWAALFPGRGES